jgi:hypothetical protein
MRSLLAFTVLALVSACSSSNTDHKLDTAEGFCSEWASKACNDRVWQACGATSADACIATQQTFCESLVPSSKYSPAHAKDCLNAVGNAYKDGTLSADERDTVLRLQNECAQVLSGPGGEHSACTTDSDCNRNDGLSCVQKTNAPGKCEKPVQVSGGHDCSAPEALCEVGFYCDGSHCLAGNNTGGECSPSIPCDPSAHCVAGAAPASGDGGTTTSTGTSTCVARADQGGSCSTDDDCISRICSIGAAGGKCLATAPPLAASDQICTNLQ